jgi:hypothetical protein
MDADIRTWMRLEMRLTVIRDLWREAGPDGLTFRSQVSSLMSLLLYHCCTKLTSN